MRMSLLWSTYLVGEACHCLSVILCHITPRKLSGGRWKMKDTWDATFGNSWPKILHHCHGTRSSVMKYNTVSIVMKTWRQARKYHIQLFFLQHPLSIFKNKAPPSRLKYNYEILQSICNMSIKKPLFPFFPPFPGVTFLTRPSPNSLSVKKCLKTFVMKIYQNSVSNDIKWKNLINCHEPGSCCNFNRQALICFKWVLVDKSPILDTSMLQ